MTETVSAAVAATPAKSPGLLARAVGVLTGPRAAYAEVAAHPKVLGILVLTLAMIATASIVFFSTEVGKTALLDQQVKGMESFGVKVSDQMYQQLEARLSSPATPYITAASQVVFIPIIGLVVSGILLAVFNAVLGGDATFKQVFAVVVHAGVVNAVQQWFVFPVDYAKESLSSPTALSIFLPFLEESSFAGRFFGSVDLFILWWMLNLAIGLGVLYKRRTQPIAVGLLITYISIVLIVAAVRTALSGA
jgi:hypothetical protein